MRTGWRRYADILTTYDPEPCEFFIALITLVRGFWFLFFVPTSRLDVLAQEKDVLSVAAIVLGVWWLLALYAGTASHHRAPLALLSTALRTYAAVVLTLDAPLAVNVPFNAGAAIISAWLYARLRRRPNGNSG